MVKAKLIHSLFDSKIFREEGFWQAFRVASRHSNATGESLPKALRDAQLLSQRRRQIHKAMEGKIASWEIGHPLNPELRVVSTNEIRKLGPQEKRFLSKLAANSNPDQMIHSYEDHQGQTIQILARDWFKWLLSNQKLSSEVVHKLTLLQHGNTNQGPGLGPFNERRAGLVLSRLADYDLIKGFCLMGDSGKALCIGKNKSKIDYSHHEEAMAIDVMIHLNSANTYEYLPLQSKSSGTLGYDQCNRMISFTAEEKKQLQELLPRVKDTAFEKDPRNPGQYFLEIKRKVFKIPLSNRKLVKSNKTDADDDIANLIMAIIESSQKFGETLILDKPYFKQSYAEKIANLINANFLTVINPDKEFDVSESNISLNRAC
ncbi:MAG: hypothetical protein LW817_04545 [Candidatus Caenarcaniphilales bacterium]|jgi:hypothetical protein|nr:hypothetical protein [Candidatus Caenarcaniphilales bacterium]